MAYQKKDLIQSRYEIAHALGYVAHMASWAIPYSTVDYLAWDVDFETRCMRENSRQDTESGYHAKLHAERLEREQAWLERRAAYLAEERAYTAQETKAA